MDGPKEDPDVEIPSRAGAIRPPIPLEAYERRHLCHKLWQHQQGECAGIDCPYCDHARQRPEPVWTGRDGRPA
jgi:hypothetical protein